MLHRLLRRANVGTQIAVRNRDVHPPVESRILAADHRRTIDHAHLCDVAQLDLLLTFGDDGQVPQLVHRVTHMTGIAQVHGIAFASLDRPHNVHATDGGINNLLDLFHRGGITGQRMAIDFNIDVTSTRGTFRIHRLRALDPVQYPLDVFADTFNDSQIGAGNLDAHRGIETGGLHIDAGLDRHQPGVVEAGYLHTRIQFRLQFLQCHPRAPLLARLKLDGGFDHGQGGGIGRRFRPPCLAEHPLDFRDGPNKPVRLLQQFTGLADGNARQGGRHVQQIALVQFRHEFRTQPSQRPQAGGQQQQDNDQRHPRTFEGGRDQGLITVDQPAVNRVVPFLPDAPANEIHHQGRHQRNRQTRGSGHGPGLGVCQRRKQPTFLGLESEHRQETQGDDEQREEQRRPDLDGGILDGRNASAVTLDRMLQVLVGILDHHNGRIYHGADRNGDTTQRHDIGIDTLRLHHQEGRQDADRQADEDDQRRAQVKQEQRAYQHHHQEFLKQAMTQCVNGACNQCRAVIGLDDLHARGKRSAQAVDFVTHRRDGLQGILAVTHDNNAANDLPLPVEFCNATAHLRPGAYLANHLQRGAGTGLAGRQRRYQAQVLLTLNITVRVHHVLGLAHLDHGTAGLAVGTKEGSLNLGDGQRIGAQQVRVHYYLVLFDHAPDRGHLRHPGNGLQFIFKEPVLQAPELGKIVFA